MLSTSQSQPLRVAMTPLHATGNPYTSLLADALSRHGCVTEEFTPGFRSRRPADIVHVHWPEQVLLSNSTSRSLAKWARFRAALEMSRRSGTRLVWTVHNLRPHAGVGRGASRRILEDFVRHVDGHVFLSETSRQRFASETSPDALRPAVRVRHGDLAVAYPAFERTAARQALRLQKEHRQVLIFGRIRAYRGVVEAAQTFINASVPNTQLRIAGLCQDQEIRTQLERLAAENPGTLLLELRLLSPEELALRITAADLVIQPFVDVMHSGAVHLALGMGTAVLAPGIGSLPELAAETGCDLLRLYDGTLTPVDIASCFEPHPPRTNTCQLGDWDAIAKAHICLYRQLRKG